MIEQIAARFYRMEIPLPNMALKSVNSYVIKGGRRNLIIDTGLDVAECKVALQTNLDKLGVDLTKTDLFLTHFHIDHFGLVPTLINNKQTIYFNRAEYDMVDRIRSGYLVSELRRSTLTSGFPEDEIENVIGFSPVYRHMGKRSLFVFLTDGEEIDIGGYRFKCVMTPGHSRRHMCLYEASKKLLISGDHILKEITPVIMARSDAHDPLARYLLSLNKIFKLDIELVLPGHGGIFSNYKERIGELREHHENRNKEIITILKGGSKNAYQVASQVFWRTNYESWNSFPAMQRFFALSETIAHLKYLEKKGQISNDIQENRIIYSL